MHTNRRLSARVLASLSVLLAACSTFPETVATTRTAAATPAVHVAPGYSGPTSNLTVELRQAYDLYGAAIRWSMGAAPKPRPAAVRRARATTASDPGTLDGDRFDRLSSCEAGQDPARLSPGGRYRGAFQFLLSTWHAAGMSGDPVDYSYGEQKRTAMSWATLADPAGQWPVCWPRSA